MGRQAGRERSLGTPLHRKKNRKHMGTKAISKTVLCLKAEASPVKEMEACLSRAHALWKNPGSVPTPPGGELEKTCLKPQKTAASQCRQCRPRWRNGLTDKAAELHLGQN